MLGATPGRAARRSPASGWTGGASAARGAATWTALAWALLLGWAAPLAAAGAPQRLEGVVVRVIDGDTLWVRLEGSARADGVALPGGPAPDPGRNPRRGAVLKLRLDGIDAPERCQAHGPQAAAVLQRLAMGRRVAVLRRATDDHGRALGSLWIDGQDVGAALVADGQAWSARYRRDPGPYAAQEAAARAAGRGLFAAPSPERPRDFRRRHGACPRA